MEIELFTDLDSFSTVELEDCIKTLPEWRAEKTLGYIHEIDRKLSCIAFCLLRKILKEKYNITNDPEWAYTTQGKPYLADHPHIHFNVSHCKEGVVCVTDNKEIGVDIESIEPFDIELAEHICNKPELEKILHSPNPARAFTALWVEKESYMKLIGTGLVDNLKDVLKNKKPNHQLKIIVTDTYALGIHYSAC